MPQGIGSIRFAENRNVHLFVYVLSRSRAVSTADTVSMLATMNDLGSVQGKRPFLLLGLLTKAVLEICQFWL